MSSKSTATPTNSKTKDTYGTGLPDLKSSALNVATTLLFSLPFFLYFDRPSTANSSPRAMLYVTIVVATFVVAVLIPPMGWWRPHPYSDFPANRGRATR